MSNPMRANLFEPPQTVKAKRTAKGCRNPRYVTAVREAKAAKARMRELAGNFTKWSRSKINREYTPARIQALLAAAQHNLKLMRAPAYYTAPDGELQ
jgi:hypothetical protein